MQGCVAAVWDIKTLSGNATIKDGIKGFLYEINGVEENELCFINGDIARPSTFYSLDNFYAFSVDGPRVVNITQNILDGLLFE